MPVPRDNHPAFETLPDYIRSGLEILSIGLNPSLPSVRAGFYFANPRNRLWRALNASGLLPERVEPGVTAQETLCNEYGIGFTDVVKRPTAGGGELRAQDYRTWAPVLRERLHAARPGIAWFHGKLAWSRYQYYAAGRRVRPDWGEQPERVGSVRVFVTPNPSPANAVYSLDDLVDWYRRLRDLRDRQAGA